MKENFEFKPKNEVEKTERETDIEDVRDRLREIISEAKLKFEEAVGEFGEREALKKVGSKVRHLCEVEADNISNEELLFYKEIEDTKDMDDDAYNRFVERLDRILNTNTQEEVDEIMENTRESFKEASRHSIRALFSDLIRDKYLEYKKRGTEEKKIAA